MELNIIMIKKLILNYINLDYKLYSIIIKILI